MKFVYIILVFWLFAYQNPYIDKDNNLKQKLQSSVYLCENVLDAYTKK